MGSWVLGKAWRSINWIPGVVKMAEKRVVKRSSLKRRDGRSHGSKNIRTVGGIKLIRQMDKYG